MSLAGRKVAIVGMGGIFPDCRNIDDFKTKLFSGQSLLREWDLATAHGKKLRSNVAGYTSEEESGLQAMLSDVIEGYPDTYIDTLSRIPDSSLATADLGSIWAMLGTQDAIKMAGWSEKEVRSEQTGVVIGSGTAGSVILRKGWHSFFELNKKARQTGSHCVDRVMVYREAANVSCLIKNQGVCESIGSACATGLGNIGHAYRLVKYGLQDRVIAGGVEGTALETFIGFDAMQVLSKGFAPHQSSRPFDKNRNGFVCAFGCGIVALEALEQAQARGANILAVIDSYFNNSDGDGDMFYPSFEGQQRLWKGLLSENPLKPQIVKAHGTSTPVGDAVELLSIVDVMGEKDYYISAPKSQFGHMLGAAGAVELIASVLMLQAQQVLPVLNAEELSDEQEAFQKDSLWKGPVKPLAAYRDLVPTTTTNAYIERIVCLNYGFGGTNSAMSISKS